MPALLIASQIKNARMGYENREKTKHVHTADTFCTNKS